MAPHTVRFGDVLDQRGERFRMKMIFTILTLAVFAGYAAASTCVEQANEKKLRSHAQESFMQKCEAEAKKACESLAKTKELSGSAKRNFVMKCVADAVGIK
jgi:hypothetical protein